MYCNQCGSALEEHFRYCSRCGTATESTFRAQPGWRDRLTRPREGIKIAGVCAGVGGARGASERADKSLAAGTLITALQPGQRAPLPALESATRSI